MAFNDALGTLAAISRDYNKEILNRLQKFQAELYHEHKAKPV
jgi:hypothetical protein